MAVAGLAGQAQAQFPRDKVALYSHLDVLDFGASAGNDCWGYVSPSGREYALMGLNNGMGVVEITDPANPRILGTIPHNSSTTGDIKVYRHYAYVASESNHGLDIVDLSNVDNGQLRLVKVMTDNGFRNSHNIALNEESGYLYLAVGNINAGALVAWNLKNDPENPFIEGQYGGNRSHDLHVITYTEGPYAGREIAFSFSESRGVEIIDVTNKGAMFLVGSSTYPMLGYCHQGWTSGDRRLLYVDDEFDEGRYGITTRTLVFDIVDLSRPTLINTFTSGSTAVDHNLYVRDGFIYEANYTSGLQIFDGNIDPVDPPRAGFFDTYPANDTPTYAGAWSVFPYFPSKTVIVSDRTTGLYVLDVREAIGGDGIPCEDIQRFKGNCKPTGKALASLKMKDAGHDGEDVVFSFTGEEVRSTIRGRKAKAKYCCFDASVTIALVDPPDCFEPIQRFCK